MIMKRAGSAVCLRPRSIAARMNFTVSASPSNTDSPTRKWPILSSTICGSAAMVSALA